MAPQTKGYASVSDYDPNSSDSQFTEIKTMLRGHIEDFRTHVAQTDVYRKDLSAKMDTHGARIQELESSRKTDRAKVIAFAAGTAAATGAAAGSSKGILEWLKGLLS